MHARRTSQKPEIHLIHGLQVVRQCAKRAGQQAESGSKSGQVLVARRGNAGLQANTPRGHKPTLSISTQIYLPGAESDAWSLTTSPLSLETFCWTTPAVIRYRV